MSQKDPNALVHVLGSTYYHLPLSEFEPSKISTTSGRYPSMGGIYELKAIEHALDNKVEGILCHGIREKREIYIQKIVKIDTFPDRVYQFEGDPLLYRIMQRRTEVYRKPFAYYTVTII